MKSKESFQNLTLPTSDCFQLKQKRYKISVRTVIKILKVILGAEVGLAVVLLAWRKAWTEHSRFVEWSEQTPIHTNTLCLTSRGELLVSSYPPNHGWIHIIHAIPTLQKAIKGPLLLSKQSTIAKSSCPRPHLSLKTKFHLSKKSSRPLKHNWVLSQPLGLCKSQNNSPLIKASFPEDESTSSKVRF